MPTEQKYSTYDALRKSHRSHQASLDAERISRLFHDMERDGCDLIADARSFEKALGKLTGAGMTVSELKGAAKLMIERAAIAEKIQKIGKRLGVDFSSQNLRVRDVIVRAAKAGDEEAIDMLASGFLEKPM